ncbi:hypothetical protein FRACYDRAFT_213539 [Fragilariopsis cylindrus CCMP1102]|uniref:Potassium channel domain-containing protein n=1 Tax=Fragilariopsis cylindrus CCMP1102 TaxID=635003 RepID=A0A1E7ELS9_9STRA|nr:hypothetical protein FRACYDRAFT_213539 [Fragilariopsis cylindrus CCMP1102]|eukprot:OEU06882.1 hypothetical protein FRACYDRAFT_213539 [Fragilariopsis cylindrus CCMP1102]
MTKNNIGKNSNSVGSSLEQCIDDSTNNNKDNNNSNKKNNNAVANSGSSLLASISFKLSQLKARIIDGIAEIAIIALSQRKRRSSNGLLNKYLFWTFRSRFLTVFFSAVFAFYSITLLFAIFIYWLGINHSKCIHVNGEDFGADTDAPFTDAFALSWTTFTTVGYGSIHPGTSITIGPSYNVAKECTGIMIVTAMEAFVGILFSATFGAIFFAKVTRVSAFAQISFSDAIIVKYSTGLTGQQDDDDNDENDDGVSSEDDVSTSSLTYKRSKLPCPFFEFRIANRLHRTRGGEIIDASINIVASIDEKQAAAQLRGQSGADRDLFRNDINIKQAKDAARRMVLSYTSKQAAAAAAASAGLNLEEENKGADSIPKRVFAKLHVESQEHPFFNRIWNVRHVLDQTSPLLRPEAKELIRFNNGHWPNELNNANALRASIHFDQILVSFSGTSNVDANSVYSQKSYGFDDLCVGYAFVNMLYRERDGSIGVDHRLLNDVNEQSGGGGEELNLRESALLNSRVSSDILIL